MEGVPKYKVRAADLPRRSLADKFLHEAIVPAIAYHCTKFQLASSVNSGDVEGVLKYTLGAAVPPTRPFTDKILHRTLVLVNVYRCAKFQLPSSFSYGNMEGSQNKKI